MQSDSGETPAQSGHFWIDRMLRLSPQGRAGGFVLLACVALVGIVGWGAMSAYSTQMTQARIATANLAKSLNENDPEVGVKHAFP